MPQSATATLSYASGAAQTLPTVGAITSSITLPSNNASSGATLSLQVSTAAIGSMPAIPAKSAQGMVYFGLTSSADVTLSAVPKFTMTLPSAPKSQGQFYAWSFNPTYGWTDLGTITVTGANVTFGGTGTPVVLQKGVQIVMIPFTAAPLAVCPTPTPVPSPTPIGVASCATSGTGAIGVLCLDKHTYAFVPKGANSQNQVGQVQIDIAATPKEWSTSNGNNPTACAGDQANLKVYCISTGNNIIAVIDPVANTESEFTDPLSTGTNDFSGGSCTICEVVIDPTDAAIIVSTIHADGNGYYDVISESSHSVMKSINVGPPPGMTENFGYDYFRNHLFQTPYTGSPSVAQMIDVASSKIYTDSVSYSSLDGGYVLIDHSGVDIGTGIGASSAEDGGSFFLVDLKNAALNSPSAGMFSASTKFYSFNSIDTTFDTDCGIPVTDLGVSSVNHLAFMTGEFGCDGPFVVAHLPSAAGTLPSSIDFAWATPPNVSGHAFADGYDPHTIAVFSASGCADCAISLDATDYTHIGVIDLGKLIAAPRKSGTHQVDPTYDLLAHGVVTYFGT
ncbi:MAG TPA: hypothetical protein VIO32_10000 [Candidatus Baltobacteraceae bacterium]